jgi:hypothetical protein
MTLTSIAKLSTAFAFAATATAALSQTTYDTTSGPAVAPAYGSSVDTSTAAGPGYGRAPSASTIDRTIANMRAACAGLSDRQTERACKQDQHHGIVDRNPSNLGNDTGNIDDQAD